MNTEERLDNIEKELTTLQTQTEQLIKAVDLHNARHFSAGLSMLGSFIAAIVAVGIAVFKH